MEVLGREDLLRRGRSLRRFTYGASLLAVAISVTVLLAWFSRWQWIDDALPFIVQMKVNTALGFAAAGIALLLMERDRARQAAWLSALPILIGLITFVEYGLGWGPAIDELLVRDWSHEGGVLPGRPAPNAALCLIGLGVAAITLALVPPSQSRRVVVKLICFLTIAIGMAAVAGQVVDSPFAIGWGTVRTMSVPAALCAMLLGAATMAYAWQADRVAISRIPVWIPLLFAFAVVLFDLVTPLEVNAGICYIPLVFCALWFERPHVAFVFAAIATLLVVFGFLASPPGQISPWIAAFNRGLAIVAIWIVATLVYLQRVATQRFLQSAHHLDTAQEIAAFGTFAYDFAAGRLTGSAAFETIHGYTQQSWAEFARGAIPPEDKERIDGAFEGARAGKPPEPIEYSFLHDDGSTRTIVMHCDLQLGDDGMPRGLVGAARDVTEQKRAESRQAEIEAQLRHAQKMESLGTMAGTVSHDLNNTLVPITTLVPFLLEEAREPEQRESLELVLRSARRARELVREILAFSRKDPEGRGPLRLDEVARETLTILRAGIPVRIALVDELAAVPPILGSRGQIYQIILNLATNASHAIGQRGGQIALGTSVEADGDGMRVRLYVADDGAGMDARTRERIFEPFFSTKRSGEGTGLGLAIVQGIVSSHAGTISVTSAPGEGTRFDLVFPAMESGEARSAA